MIGKRLYAGGLLTWAALLVAPALACTSSEPQAQYIDLGNTTQGTLSSERPADWWEFQGRAGQVVRVVVRSEGFLPSLQVLASDHQELPPVSPHVDDPADRFFVLPRSDRYRIAVTGGAGTYELATGAIEPVGSLQSGVPAIASYESHELLWSFAGQAGQAVVIRATGLPGPLQGGTPPVVHLLAPDGEVLDHAVEYGLECRACQDTNVEHGARLIAFLPTSGDYRVLVGMLHRPYRTPASYEITMRVVEDANVLASGSSANGALDSRQDVDIWTLESGGQPLVVTIDSSTYGVIGMLVEGTATQVGTALVASTPNSRPRRVVVTSNRGPDPDATAFGTGEYTVTLEDAARLPAVQVGPVPGDNSVLATNVWRVEGRAGQILGISVRDSWFGNLVELYSPRGEQIVDGWVDYVYEEGAYSARLPTSGSYMLRMEDVGAVSLWMADMGDLAIGARERGVMRGVAWRDHWRFRCPVGEMVVLTVSLGEDMDLLASGSGVYSSSTGEVEGVSTGSGQYAAFCSDPGEHWFAVMASPRGMWDPGLLNREIEYDVLLSTVAATPLGTGDIQLGDLSDGGVDFWGFAGTAGQLINFTFSTERDGLPDVRWYSDTGEVMLRKRLFAGDALEESVQMVLPYSGRYFMDVSDWRGEMGAYGVLVH